MPTSEWPKLPQVGSGVFTLLHTGHVPTSEWPKAPQLGAGVAVGSSDGEVSGEGLIDDTC